MGLCVCVYEERRASYEVFEVFEVFEVSNQQNLRLKFNINKYEKNANKICGCSVGFVVNGYYI